MNLLRGAKKNVGNALDCVYMSVSAVSMLHAMGSYVPDLLRQIIGTTEIFSRNTIVDSFEVLDKIVRHETWRPADVFQFLSPDMWYIDLFLVYWFYLLLIAPVIRAVLGRGLSVTMLSPWAFAGLFVTARHLPQQVGIVLGFAFVILNVVLAARSIYLIYRTNKDAQSEVTVLGCGKHQPEPPAIPDKQVKSLQEELHDAGEVIDLRKPDVIHAPPPLQQEL